MRNLLKKTLVLISMAAPLGLMGCASNKGVARVTFTHPEARNQASLYELFPNAYIRNTRDGEYDIVLVSDVIGNSKDERAAKGPLLPVSAPPMQQAMHIHVFWKPVASAIIRESSITNAIIHWYVFGDAQGSSVNSVHYEGAGFVNLDPGGRMTSITIGDAKIEPKDVHGNMRDPIGSSQISGTITAVRNDHRVTELLKTLAEQSASNERFWTGSAMAR